MEKNIQKIIQKNPKTIPPKNPDFLGMFLDGRSYVIGPCEKKPNLKKLDFFSWFFLLLWIYFLKKNAKSVIFLQKKFKNVGEKNG